ncbi:hypothetical protein HDU91_002100, partial [Kappamyces sp. JEL0680]
MFLALCIAASAAASSFTFQSETQSQIDFDAEETAAWTVRSIPAIPNYQLRVRENVSLCDPTVNQISGYLDVLDQDAHYYFWFFESRDKPKTDPLVLWLNGGPGCSSFTGLLMELGPCTVDDGFHSSSTTLNAHSWNSHANVVFLDQPVGTGFSYGSRKDKSSADAAEGVYNFLQILFDAYPQYAGLPFHVTGESYAGIGSGGITIGHYVPEVARVIVQGNGDPSSHHVNLQSIAIGNGITDALTQYEYFPDMAEDPKYGPILSKEDIQAMRDGWPLCKFLSEQCYAQQNPLTCVPASKFCYQTMYSAYERSGRSPYDVRHNASYFTPMEDNFEAWLNRKDIQAQLGVTGHRHVWCSEPVGKRFDDFGDHGLPIVSDIPPLLEANIRVLIYAGDA